MEIYQKIIDFGAGALPATAVVALCLFVTREIIELIKRYKSNGRKRKVLRRIIAEDLKRNHWLVKSLNFNLNSLQKALEKDEDISITYSALGVPSLSISQDGQRKSSSPIGEVKREALEKNIILFAEIDAPNFEKALEAMDALNQLQHIRTSLIEYVSDTEMTYVLTEFVDYGRREVSDASAQISSFYESITGEPLVEHKVR